LQGQVPEEVIELVLYLFGTVLDGRNTSVTDGVRRTLVRAPPARTRSVLLRVECGEVDDG
jgi:hypothetical protein